MNEPVGKEKSQSETISCSAAAKGEESLVSCFSLSLLGCRSNHSRSRHRSCRHSIVSRSPYDEAKTEGAPRRRSSCPVILRKNKEPLLFDPAPAKLCSMSLPTVSLKNSVRPFQSSLHFTGQVLVTLVRPFLPVFKVLALFAPTSLLHS